MEKHYVNRTNWLRAAVLGANDGIISTTSLVIGVAAANASRSAIVLTALAGLVSGACSMAAGEYVSVSSQTDVEGADLKREQQELENNPEAELEELVAIFAKRGLEKELAVSVAIQLSDRNVLETHAREELGINEVTKPNPLEAAMSSAASFISGGLLPFLVALLAPIGSMIYLQYGFAIVFLALSGGITARMGGAPMKRAIFRICFWGTVAMLTTALVGYIFGVEVG